ncbi:hypothetical protein DTO046C5_1768 [Penicillium roqueforti]|nr:hypothetical protein DTO046C5_1768 [Penicillium roqueforti]
MIAPRSSSLRAVRALSQQPVASAARRSLHITGVQAAQPVNPGEKALSNHDVLQSRAFSIAMRRINGNAFSDPSSRQFNTSRASKATHDNSTVDFVYMPSMAELDAAPLQRPIQVPVLSGPSTRLQTPSPPSMKPQIYTVSGGAGPDVQASAMSEVVDNHAVDFDPFSLTEAVGRSRAGEELQRKENGTSGPGVIRELWAGFVDDVLGPKQSVRK